MKNNIMREKPFEFLRDRNGEKFSEETVKNWYKSRAYVLENLSKTQKDVVVDGDSPLMLAVVRHIALFAHYISNNPTVITLVMINTYKCSCIPSFSWSSHCTSKRGICETSG